MQKTQLSAVLFLTCLTFGVLAHRTVTHKETFLATRQEPEHTVTEPSGHSPGTTGAPGSPDRGLPITKKKAKHDWNYDDVGAWSNEFAVCGEGKAQSPINVDTSAIVFEGKEKLWGKISYTPLGNRNLRNTGHNVQVNANGLGYLEMPDGKYLVHQFHFHFPSEHEVDGKLSAGEMHIVHQKEGSVGTKDLLVVGIMFDEGAESPFLKQLGFVSPMPGDESAKAIPGKVDMLGAFSSVLKGGFYRYEGSLTTPPCSETVKWIVMKEHPTVSPAQVNAFKALYPAPQNNRPVQALHSRAVEANVLEVGEGSTGEHDDSSIWTSWWFWAVIVGVLLLAGLAYWHVR